MPLAFEVRWERLDAGAPEERAGFAALGIRAGNEWLTEAEDVFVESVRREVFLSAYRLAEWFAWNWWRLRWEPHAPRPDWALAHRMSTIGGGYVWPNITIISDCERVILLAEPTRRTPAEPLFYIADTVVAITGAEFEEAVAAFIDLLCARLRMKNAVASNLQDIWNEVLLERADPHKAQHRKLEALLGFDPEEADSAVIARLLEDERSLGPQALVELAASRTNGGVMTAALLYEIARTSGFEARPGDTVRLTDLTQLPPVGRVPAWQRGAQAARALRAQERLGVGAISNERLGELAGVSCDVLGNAKVGPDMSFALDDGELGGRVVFRSKWETGRRFALARLLGDRIGHCGGDRLLPATNAGTYRQKFQRAFAGELLCPFDALEERLGGDYSDESIDDAARHFNVSPLTVRTQLVNHDRLDRERLGDLETRATTSTLGDSR